jgi:hypothetical protein
LAVYGNTIGNATISIAAMGLRVADRHFAIVDGRLAIVRNTLSKNTLSIE